MADIMDDLDDMAPLERVPSHSTDPTPAEAREMQVRTKCKPSCKKRCCYREIPAGPPGSGAVHRQSRSNPKPRIVLISSPIKSESEAATPRAGSADIDPLSLNTAEISDDSDVSPTSGSAPQYESHDSMSPNLLYMGYYFLTSTPDKGKSKESSHTDFDDMPTSDKGTSRESSCITVEDKGHSRGSSGMGLSSAGPATPTFGWTGLRGNALPFEPASMSLFPCASGAFPGGNFNSLVKPDKVTADAHPLEPWRRAGIEIVDFEAGQSPIDALFLLQDVGWVESQRANSDTGELVGESNYSPEPDEPGQAVDSAMAEFVREYNYSTGVDRKFRRPSIMAMSESAASDGSEPGDGTLMRSLRTSSWNGTRTWSWVLSEPEEALELEQRIELLHDSWRNGEVHLVSRDNMPSKTSGTIPFPGSGFRPHSFARTVAKSPQQRRQSLPSSHKKHPRHLRRRPSNQPSNQLTWASRLNRWPFIGSASDEANTKLKELSKWDIWDDMEETLRDIMRALTVKTSQNLANIWVNVPSWGLVDTPDETTTERFRDRAQCAVVAIHRLMCITRDSLRLLHETRGITPYEWTMCDDWEAASTRALLAVLAAGAACNGYMNAIVQGEHESLTLREAKVAGDTKAMLRKRAKAIHDITKKLRGLFEKLDMRLGWVSKTHDEKHEAAIKLFDSALEAGLIGPAWWRDENRENIIQLAKFSSTACR